jgi:vancomycin resistance protein YoaR
MCGIVGYIGKQKALPILMDGIKNLEYRGYDSAGFAVLTKSGNIKSGFDKEALKNYLTDEVAEQIDVPLQEAKFILENGRVKEFAPSRDGVGLNIEKSIENIERNLDFPEPDVELVADTVKSKVTTESVNDLGIIELLGVGKSDFAGSPTNRRHNIKIGARSLHGVLIKPGEEFSLVKTLGDINGATGYLPELVIKGNKTVPEFGGGLCQIGTTTFRAALDSGVPITERQNHSYRVRYYEPAGVDATIYGPHPDFRFVNDTGNHILIQTRIEGDSAIFEFWGTRDGRAAEKTEPKIFNVVPAPAIKYIETEDLPEGVKKCTEQAHAGADTVFTYTVP